MGTSLREIVFDIGGGIPGEKKFKSCPNWWTIGWLFTRFCLDTRVDYENLKSVGAMMGSGGFVVWMRILVWLILQNSF